MKHLEENNISYWKHLKFSMTQSTICLKAAFFLFVHSLFPNVFESNGSKAVSKVADNLKIAVTKRRSFRPLRNKSTKNKQ